MNSASASRISDSQWFEGVLSGVPFAVWRRPRSQRHELSVAYRPSVDHIRSLDRLYVEHSRTYAVNGLVKCVRRFHELEWRFTVECSLACEITKFIETGTVKSKRWKHFGQSFEDRHRETPSCVKMKC